MGQTREFSPAFEDNHGLYFMYDNGDFYRPHPSMITYDKAFTVFGKVRTPAVSTAFSHGQTLNITFFASGIAVVHTKERREVWSLHSVSKGGWDPHVTEPPKRGRPPGSKNRPKDDVSPAPPKDGRVSSQLVTVHGVTVPVGLRDSRLVAWIQAVLPRPKGEQSLRSQVAAAKLAVHPKA